MDWPRGVDAKEWRSSSCRPCGGETRSASVRLAPLLRLGPFFSDPVVEQREEGRYETSSDDPNRKVL